MKFEPTLTVNGGNDNSTKIRSKLEYAYKSRLDALPGGG